LAVIALAGLVYWGIGKQSPSGRIQDRPKPYPAQSAARKDADPQKQPPHERTAKPDVSVARPSNRTASNSNENSPGIKEYNIPVDSSPTKLPASDHAGPASTANPPVNRASTQPGDTSPPKRSSSFEAGRMDSPHTNNPSEIRIDVTPAEIPQQRESEQAKVVESSARTAIAPTKSPEPAPASPDSSVSNATVAESRTHSGSSSGSTHKSAETSQANQGSLLALMSPPNEPVSGPPALPHPPLPPTATPLARVAIVIDDFGPDLEVAKKFLKLPIPITFSILPYQRYSREIAQLAHSGNGEVILHMPMEPQDYPKANPGKGALFVSMSAETVHKTFQTALNSSPHISGMNNHMGSRFTENAAFMKIVLSELHQRGLYFLDSGTSPKSVGVPIARKLQLPCRQRDIFLDHTVSEDVTRSQIEQLIRKAKIQGTAIAIGHPHESTLRALRRQSDRFRQEKIGVVPLAEIIRSSDG